MSIRQNGEKHVAARAAASKGRRLVILLIATSAAAILAACNPSPGAIDDSSDDDEPPLGLTMATPTTGIASVPFILGRGYDVCDSYAQIDYVRSAVLDYAALDQAGEVQSFPEETTTYNTAAGSSTSTYQENLGTYAKLSGHYKYFSGTLKTAFSSSDFSSSSNQYATIMVNHQKYLYAVADRTSPDSLKPFMTENFRNDINDASITPQQLFRKYGTHALAAIMLGARYNYNLSAAKTNTSSSTQIKGFAQASFKNLFSSVNAECGFDTSSVDTSAFSTEDSNATAVGGNSTKIASNNGFMNWVDSINDASIVFSDFAANGLIPIWDFCDDQGRKTAIESAFSTWSDDRFNDYTDGLKGTLTIRLEKLFNRNVGDEHGNAEWLWKVKALSSIDNTTHILSARTSRNSSKDIGKNCYYAFDGASVTLSNVPLSSSNTFSITPMLEEDDGNDLGVTDSNNDDNDLYCTDASGPKFDFLISTDNKVVFSGVNTPHNKAKGYFSLSHGGLSNDSLSLDIGSKSNPSVQRFYLVLKQFDNTSSSEWVEFILTMSWQRN